MAETDQPPLNSDECRAPTLEDVVRLCHALNEARAKYIVIGGFAIRAAGFLRNTMDIPDRLFLQQLLQKPGSSSKLPGTQSKKPGGFGDWLRRILGNQ